MAFNPSWKHAAGIGVTYGLAMGFFSVFVGPPAAVEFLIWTLITAAIVWWIVTNDIEGPFWTTFMVAVFSGIAIGPIQGIFQDTYEKTHPEWEKMGGFGQNVIAFIVAGIVIGAVWGLLSGAIAHWWANRRTAAPTDGDAPEPAEAA